MTTKKKTTHGTYSDRHDEFDVSDSVPEAADDEVTQRHVSIRPKYMVDVVDMSDIDDVKTFGIIEPEIEIEAVVGPDVHGSFVKFWPDHMDHELIGQAGTPSVIILYCSDCDLSLHIPVNVFMNWKDQQ